MGITKKGGSPGTGGFWEMGITGIWAVTRNNGLPGNWDHWKNVLAKKWGLMR